MPVTTDNEELVAYAQKVCDALEAENVRVELDARAEKLGYRMREGQVQKVPYLLVIGNNEKKKIQYLTDFTVSRKQQRYHLMNLSKS